MDARNKPLAFYKVTTDYQPLFFSFLRKASSVN
jgi:tight adherence protein E